MLIVRITTPFTQFDTNLRSVLSSIDSSYDAVEWYDVTDKSDHWKINISGKPYGNDLSEINEKMGFWIHITSPGGTNLVLNGEKPSNAEYISLHSGWNLVGYPSLSPRNRTAALNNLIFPTEVNSVWTFNAATQLWEEIEENGYFEVGKGYWIHAKTDCVWEVLL